MTDKDNKEQSLTPLAEESQFKGRKRAKAGSERPIKISAHASGLIMTHDTKREKEILDSVGAGAGIPYTLDRKEQVKRVAQVVARSMGLTDINSSELPDQIGFNLKSEPQRRILFAYLKRLTDTGYQGNYQIPTNKEIERNAGDKSVPSDLPKQIEGYQVSSNRLGGAYQNIPQIPAIRITKAELMTEAGFDSDQDYKVFSEAILALSKDQHFCMWRRIKRDDKGRIVKNKMRRAEFEIVSQFSPVLNIRGILNETGEFLYYEITPPPVFLDQVSEDYGGSYFVLIPADCEEEISAVVPKGKKVSPFVRPFLLWLRLRYQKIYNSETNPFYHRKSEDKPAKRRSVPYVAQIDFETLCQEIGISESVYKTKRKRAEDIIRSSIEIAIKIGYLTKETHNQEGQYKFYLNKEYFDRVRQSNIEEFEDTIPEDPQEGVLLDFDQNSEE